MDMTRQTGGRSAALIFSTLLCMSIMSVPVVGAETSKVLRFRLPKLVQERYDAEVVLYHRGGVFHNGYVLLPGRDNLVHRLDVTPSPEVQFVDKGGMPIDVPKEALGYYSYKNKKWLAYKAQYFAGEISIKHPNPIKPLSWDGDKLMGDLDILILHPDAVNTPGRSGKSLVYRLKIDAKKKGDAISGRAMAWIYANKDPKYGSDNPKRTMVLSGAWDAEHWRAKNGSQYARGSDWPMAHGPKLTASAVPCKSKLVNTLHDARLVWVSELSIASGRGGGLMRGGFCMYPIAWTNQGEGGYGGPIIADNKVFAYVPSIDLAAATKKAEAENNPYYRLGADSRLACGDLARDSLYAFDARTGKLLWEHHEQPGSASHNGGKGGKASTPCYYKGRVYQRLSKGIACFDADTGKKLWFVKGQRNTGSWGLGGAPADASIVVVGGTLVFGSGHGKHGWRTVGISPKDGSVKWILNDIGGGDTQKAWPGMAIPGVYRTGGKEYLVLGRSMPDRKYSDGVSVPESFVLADPADGKVLWESRAMGYNGSQILVVGDVAVGNVRDGLLELSGKENSPDKASRVGGVRISLKGAKPLWKSADVNYVTRRSMNIAHDGIVYLDTKRVGFRAIDAKTGKQSGRLPGIYEMSRSSHNWAWHVASNDRIITDGVLMFSTADKGFEQLPGRLSLDVSGGYLSATKPAIADGRIVMRLSDKIVCYDLRQTSEAARTEVISLVAEDATVSGTISADVPIMIRKRGDKLISISGRAPKTATDDVNRSTSWGPVDWSTASHGRNTIPRDLVLTGDSLKGSASVRLGFQYERFQFDLKRSGDKFSGRYVRTTRPLKKPLNVKGDVVGPIVRNPDGTRYFNCYLLTGAAGVRDLKNFQANAGISIIVSCKRDTVIGAAAVAGRMNLASHEVQIENVTVKGDSIKGTFVVIVHDDIWGDMHIDSAASEFRVIGEGPALAMRYTLEASGAQVADKEGKKRLENKGSYTGTIGVAWKREGIVTGELAAESDR